MNESLAKQNARKNLKLYDEVFYNFAALAKVKNMTQNDLLEQLTSSQMKQFSDEEQMIFNHI